MGSPPPGPVAGGAPRVWRASPVHRLCHAVAPRHSHRVVELAQRMRLCHLVLDVVTLPAASHLRRRPGAVQKNA